MSTFRKPLRAMRIACLATLAVAPGVANAGKVVLAPLLADATITAKQKLGVHQLIASELDFVPELDGVVDLDAPPPTLDAACLANAKCLGGIASANGGQLLVSGQLTGAGDNYVLDLVYFDGTKIARRKAFTVPQDPTSLANAMTPIVRELLTGEGIPDKSQSTASRANDFALEDDIAVGAAAGGMIAADIDDGLVDAEPMAPAPAPVPTKRPAPAPAPAPVSKGDSRRLAAATMATGLATGAAAGTAASAPPPPAPAPAPVAPPPAPSDDDLAQSLAFSTSASDITAEQIDAMIKFGPPPTTSSVPTPEPVVMASAPPAPRSSGMADARIDEEEEEDLSRSQDLDARTRTTRPPPEGIGHIFQATIRGGYSRYYSFDFLTTGGEVGFAVANGLHVVAGVEMYAVKRVLPPEVAFETRIYSEWNFIFPLNVGAVYKFALGRAQPYVGVDTIFVQYYKDDIGADWAVGGRVRGGLDYMFIPNFGLNVNVAVGGWSGQNWGLIEDGVGKAGFLPQVSAGTVIAF